MSPPGPRLGIRENALQFGILVLVNAFVGAMVGLERSILPLLADAHLPAAATAAVLSFIAAFGLAKAGANLATGPLVDRHGRKAVLVAGWVVALPVPGLLLAAEGLGLLLAANVLLGLSQGLAWSTTVVMKVDLAGPRQRGLAMGLNEFAGYVAVALMALVTGMLADRHGLGPAPFALGLGVAVVGLALSLFAVRDTRAHVAAEVAATAARAPAPPSVFRHTSFAHPSLSSACQAGFVNNLIDGLAWGLLPLLAVAAGRSLDEVGVLAALVPGVWGVGQLATGAASDRLGRKPFIVGGMLVQGLALAGLASAAGFGGFAAAAALLGLGTAMVYPTLLASLGDHAGVAWRARAVGVYRLWRDLGYVAGALGAGLLADALGIRAAFWAAAGLSVLSGLAVQLRMRRRPVPAGGPVA